MPRSSTRERKGLSVEEVVIVVIAGLLILLGLLLARSIGPTSASVQHEHHFVSTVRLVWPGDSEDNLLALGYSVCDDLAATDGDDTYLRGIVNWSDKQYSATVDAATTWLCPQYGDNGDGD